MMLLIVVVAKWYFPLVGGPHYRPQTLKSLSWDPQIGTPNFGKPPNSERSAKEGLSFQLLEAACSDGSTQRVQPNILPVHYCSSCRPLGYLIFSLMALKRDPIY